MEALGRNVARQLEERNCSAQRLARSHLEIFSDFTNERRSTDLKIIQMLNHSFWEIQQNEAFKFNSSSYKRFHPGQLLQQVDLILSGNFPSLFLSPVTPCKPQGHPCSNLWRKKDRERKLSLDLFSEKEAKSGTGKKVCIETELLWICTIIHAHGIY